MNNYLEDIETYINNEMDAEAQAAFERAMREDPALRAAVEQQRELIKDLMALRLREKVKKNLQSPERNSFTWFAGRRLLAAAAFLVLVAAAIFLWLEGRPDQPSRIAEQPVPSSPPKIPTQKPLPADSLPVVTIPIKPQRGIHPKVQKAFARVVAKLESVDYTVMGAAEKDVELEKTINQAINLLKREQASKALPLLEAAAARHNELYQEDVDWLLALTWLVLEPGKGKARLQTISGNPAHSKRLDALELLHQLK